jgi:hypothetical protein
VLPGDPLPEEEEGEEARSDEAGALQPEMSKS